MLLLNHCHVLFLSLLLLLFFLIAVSATDDDDVTLLVMGNDFGDLAVIGRNGLRNTGSHLIVRDGLRNTGRR